jgi:hypothetical protein
MSGRLCCLYCTSSEAALRRRAGLCAAARHSKPYLTTTSLRSTNQRHRHDENRCRCGAATWNRFHPCTSRSRRSDPWCWSCRWAPIWTQSLFLPRSLRELLPERQRSASPHRSMRALSWWLSAHHHDRCTHHGLTCWKPYRLYRWWECLTPQGPRQRPELQPLGRPRMPSRRLRISPPSLRRHDRCMHRAP